MPHLAGTEFLPSASADSLTWLTVEQMVEADRLAIEVFGITLLQMMEHAGSALAELVMRAAPEGRVTVLAGGGNNGGGGLCAVRHLVARGRDVEVVLASDRLGEAARHHLATLAAMGIMPSDRPSGDVAVDALVGYGLSGPLRERAAELAQWANDHTPISLDFPSGYDFEGAVEPAATLTLALPKTGLRGLDNLYLADLGLPHTLWARMSVDSGTPFAEGHLVRVES
ncbi:MAG: NAD(P)H-hydrate epimerase [Actinobacteria bacterium HGW-Actinobacteria-7]|nr:MAG: NAD(P)H-hydrate epimerase [Actinobacteria bacterium HGW-Actinobacteria-7]